MILGSLQLLVNQFVIAILIVKYRLFPIVHPVAMTRQQLEVCFENEMKSLIRQETHSGDF